MPSLSKVFKSNKKQKNIKEKKVKFQNNISFTNNKNNKYNHINGSQKKSKISCSKSNINTSGKKTANDSEAYDFLYKITERFITSPKNFLLKNLNLIRIH